MVRLRAVLGGWMIAGFAWASLGCGTDALAVDGCRRIEQARCRKAGSCPNLGVMHVEACVQFARDQCLHGLPSEPAGARLDQCVTAIEQATTCSIVETPEADPACSFLQTGTPADAGDSGETASDHDTPAAEASTALQQDAAAVPDASSAGSVTGTDGARDVFDVGVETGQAHIDAQDG